MPTRSFSSTRVRRCLSSAFALAALPVFAGAQTITNLGNLPGTVSSSALGISADGTIVAGTSLVGFASQARGFRWTAATGMTDVGLLPGGDRTQIFAISGNGTKLVGEGNSFGSQGEAIQSGGVGVAKIGGTGVLPGGGGAMATGVSADGLTVVGSSFSPVGSRAFRSLGASGPLEDLGVLPGFTDASNAKGVSGDGLVIIGSSMGPTSQRAFRYTQAGGMMDLGSLPGANTSEARCTNADGSVIAGSVSGPGFTSQFFRWTAPSGMVLIEGPLSAQMLPNAMTADGSVIVGTSSNGGSGGAIAALWSPCLGTVDLNTYLPTRGVNLSGWVLRTASAITPDGNSICGTGTFNGVGRSWLVSGLGNAAGTSFRITSQPGGSFGCFGYSGSMSVSAAPANPSVRWQARVGEAGPWIDLSDGQTLVSDDLPQATFSTTHTSTLSFSDVQAQGALYARAILTSSCGELTSDPAIIVAFNNSCCGVAGPAGIGTQPQGGSRLPGQSISLNSQATGGSPRTTRWQLLGGPLTQWTTLTDGSLVVNNVTRASVSGSAGENLTLSNLQFAPGQIRARFVNTTPCGLAISDEATIVIEDPCPTGSAPHIDFDLASDTRGFGEDISYSESASGLAPLGYQWQINGGPFADWTALSDGPLLIDGIQRAIVSGATTDNLSLNALRFDPGALGLRWVVTNACGVATSNTGTLNINARFCFPEDYSQFVTQPVPVAACAGQTASFSAEVAGFEPLGKQWQLRGGPLSGWTNLVDGDLVIDSVTRASVSGASSSALTLSALAFESGELSVRLVLENECSIAISDTVALTISNGCCPKDFNHDNDVNPDDLGDFITCYFSSPPCAEADFNHDSDINPDDLGDFITTYFGPPC